MYQHELEAMQQALAIRNYAKKTISTYLSVFKRFLNQLTIPLSDVTPDVIQRWQYQLVKQGISWTLFNQMVCALRFYFVQVKHYDWAVKHIPFQRRERKLPVVLNKHDINRLLAQATLQPRSHAICATLYSTGIRLSELVNLQVKDIDSTRMLIHIRRGKGAKQRQVQLSHSLLVILRTYWKSSRSTTWLFPGNPCSKPIDTSMIQRLLDSLGKAAGIAQKVTPHMLRHSFATHLLEDKVDLRTIQALLGHSNILTTSKYLHVATHHISALKNPLDTLSEGSL